jgi:hypothetical protein
MWRMTALATGLWSVFRNGSADLVWGRAAVERVVGAVPMARLERLPVRALSAAARLGSTRRTRL